MATAESSKFADILSAALSQHHRFPGDLHNPGSEPRSPSLQADSLPYEPPGKPDMQYSLYLILCSDEQVSL